MDKQIVQLSRDPFAVSLKDRPCSIFIDPKAGTVLIDEGEGDNRVNGAVMYPDRGPRFSVNAEAAVGEVLRLDYCGFPLIVGAVSDATEAEAWASLANAFLASKSGQSPGEMTTPNGAKTVSASDLTGRPTVDSPTANGETAPQQVNGTGRARSTTPSPPE